MSVDVMILLVIVGSALVTFIPRVFPFLLVKNVTLPAPITKWLSFIPICILTALIVDSIIIQDEQSLLQIDWEVIAVMIPTLFIAIWTKSLSITVLVGIIVMALVRFIL